MSTTTVDTTLEHRENDVLILQLECAVEVEYIYTNDGTGDLYVIKDIKAFIFEGDGRKARIERGRKDYAYFLSILDYDELLETVANEEDARPECWTYARGFYNAALRFVGAPI